MSVYFDAQGTQQRAPAVLRAIEAGKHIYCEKPTATSTAEAFALYEQAKKKGVKNGVVQDKLWLPGLMKLADLKAKGFFGRIFSVRGEFGYWVFEGDLIPAQRPSWNYRKEAGGGIVVDMLCHWRYVLDNLFGAVKAVSCLAATHIPERRDEDGAPYPTTADDAAYSTFELEGGVIAHFNSSWETRVRRDDLLTLHVDGTHGSAVAGLRDCWIQPYAATPRPVWNPDIPNTIDFFATWQKLPDQRNYDNAFKVQWELFLRHVASPEGSRALPLGPARGRQGGAAGREGARVLREALLGEPPRPAGDPRMSGPQPARAGDAPGAWPWSPAAAAASGWAAPPPWPRKAGTWPSAAGAGRRRPLPPWKSLRAQGAQALYVQADIGDDDAPERLLAAVRVPASAGWTRWSTTRASRPGSGGTSWRRPARASTSCCAATCAGPTSSPRRRRAGCWSRSRRTRSGAAASSSSPRCRRPCASINRGEYCISKAGLSMASLLWAARLADDGILVYEVRPGIIRTDMTAGVAQKYDALFAQGIALQRRWGTPEDVGRAVAMLARGDLAYSTGQVIMVDGGMTVQKL